MKARRQFSIWSSLIKDIRTEAKARGVSSMTVVQNALEQYLHSHTLRMKLEGRMVSWKLKKVKLDEPEVILTLDEQRDADEAMRIFREEDR
jgi:hypothetical protein